jgi:hypothetical protein
VVSDWAWKNTVFGENTPNCDCYFEHDYAISKEDYKIYNTIIGDAVRETAKAVCIEVLEKCYNHRCELTGKTFKWRYWIPKSQIIEGSFYYEDNYQMAEKWAKVYKEMDMNLAV